MKTELARNMLAASTAVLETMFFTEPVLLDAQDIPHQDPISCDVVCSGAETGIFSITIDREALSHLCACFYGGDEQPSERHQCEVLCEFTNMVAGSTLSTYAPRQTCRLSPPSLCNPDLPLEREIQGPAGSASVALLLEGGLVSLCCTLRSAA